MKYASSILTESLNQLANENSSVTLSLPVLWCCELSSSGLEIIEQQVGRDLKHHLVQPCLAEARSRQDDTAPCPAKCIWIRKGEVFPKVCALPVVIAASDHLVGCIFILNGLFISGLVSLCYSFIEPLLGFFMVQISW